MRKTILQSMCILLLIAATTLWGQSVSGTLSGKVLAANGTVIPNAAVTVTNVSSNTSQKVLTGPDGSFSVSGLPPGTYRVDVETAGYKRTSQQNVELTTNTPETLNITLEAGSTTETVEIKGFTPVVQNHGGEVSVALGTRTVRELPVIDRNYQQLVGLQSGITPPQPALDIARDPDRNRYFSAIGQAPSVNTPALDGVINLEPFRGSAVRVTPEETVQQLNIITANETADKGFTGGALYTAVTPGGTNDFHGSLYEFYSGDFLRTRNPFNTNGNPDPRFVYNQFGASAGGPIVRDQTFIFGSYEGTYQNGANTLITTVPTAQALTGNFNGIPGLVVYNPNSGINGANRVPFANNNIPGSLINPTARTIAGFFPAANMPGFFNNFITNAPLRDHANRADGRVDQHFGDRTSAFLRYGFSNDWSLQGSPLGNVIGAGTRGRLLAQNVVGDVTHAFSAGLVADLRFGYNRYDQRINLSADQTPLANALGLTNFNNNLVGINISGLGAIGAPAWVPEHGVDNTFNWVASFAWHTSHHNVKAGVDIRRIRSDGFTDSYWASMFGPNGTAFFGPGATLTSNGPGLSQFGLPYSSFAAFLLGAPSQVGISNFLVSPTIRQSQYGAWIGDTVQLMHRVTLDLGLRYEIYGPLEPRNPGGAAFFDPTTNSFNFAGVGGVNQQLTNYNYDAIAPRIGLAFSPTNRTVIRGGYGIQYFQTPYMLSGLMAPITGSVAGVQGGYTVAPFQGLFSGTVTSTTPPPATLQNGAAAGNLPATVVPVSTDTPYVQTFSLQVQQQLYADMMLSVGYVGALDRHLPYIQELNAAMPGTGVAGLPFFAMGRTASTLLYGNGLTSNYNSLQVNLMKRFAGGLSFLASYTYSKALGYTTANGLLLNPFNLRQDYGPLDYDRQHVLQISHIWELPFGKNGNNILASALGGWQLNGVFTWDSGVPLTVTADPIGCACPGNTVLASLNGSAFLNNGNAILNPTAFSTPAVGQFGNLGRGAIRAPGFKNYDLSLFKTLRVHDYFKLELRAEAYNLTNTPHFASPVSNINSPDFGQVVSTVNGAFGRQFNLGIRALF